MRRHQECFGSYLRSIRKLRSLNVENIAALVGVSEETWNRWESNSLQPCALELKDLVRLLELSPYKQERLAYLLEMKAGR